MIFYFNFSNRLAPLLMSEMLFPLSGRKKRVKWHKQNQQGKVKAAPVPIWQTYIPKCRTDFRASGSWLCQILHISNHFHISLLLLHNVLRDTWEWNSSNLPPWQTIKMPFVWKKRCTTKQLLLTSQQISPKPTRYWHSYFLPVFVALWSLY